MGDTFNLHTYSNRLQPGGPWIPPTADAPPASAVEPDLIWEPAVAFEAPRTEVQDVLWLGRIQLKDRFVLREKKREGIGIEMTASYFTLAIDCRPRELHVTHDTLIILGDFSDGIDSSELYAVAVLGYFHISSCLTSQPSFAF